MQNCFFIAAELGLSLHPSVSDTHSAHISFCGSISIHSYGFFSLILFLEATTLACTSVPSAEIPMGGLLSTSGPQLQGPSSSEGLPAALPRIVRSFIFVALIPASEYLVQILMTCLFKAIIPENRAGAP